MGCQHRPCSSPLADGAVWPYCGQGEFLNFSKRQEFSEVVNGAGWWGRSQDLGLVSLRACARKIGAVRASGSEDFWDPGWWSRKLKASILQGCHWHACILCWSPSFAPVPASCHCRPWGATMRAQGAGSPPATQETLMGFLTITCGLPQHQLLQALKKRPNG